MSCSVAKHALPITRFSIMRPATATRIALRLERLVAFGVVRRVQVGGERVAAEVVRVRLPGGAQLRELRAALGDDLVLVGRAAWSGRRGRSWGLQVMPARAVRAGEVEDVAGREVAVVGDRRDARAGPRASRQARPT